MLPKRKILIGVATAALLSYCQTVCAIQSGTSQDKAYYNRPDVRANDVESQNQRADLVHDTYREMLTKTNNRVRQTEASKDHVYPGSYQIPGRSERYVRKELPQRLIPPGRTAVDQPSPYSLKRTVNTAPPNYQYTTQGAPQSAPQSAPQATPQANRIPSQSPAYGGQNLNYSGQNYNELNLSPVARPTNQYLPPIVRPQDVPGVQQQQQPQQFAPPPPQARTVAPQPPRARPRYTARPQNQPQAVTIPTKYNDAEPAVTRARILMVQDSQQNPFTEPELKSELKPDRQDLRNPFSDPPQDLDQKPRNPFEDPPSDLQPQQPRQDPFGQNSGQMPDVDPFPANPGDIRQNDDVAPSREPRNVIPDFPDDPPADEPADEPDETEFPDDFPPDTNPNTGPGESGPFEQNGFMPKPILPAPPSREFEQFVVPQSISQPFGSQVHGGQGAPGTQGDSGFRDQPSHFNDGSVKQVLYEGVSGESVEPGGAGFGCSPLSCQTGRTWPNFISRWGNKDKHSNGGSQQGSNWWSLGGSRQGSSWWSRGRGRGNGCGGAGQGCSGCDDCYSPNVGQGNIYQSQMVDAGYSDFGYGNACGGDGCYQGGCSAPCGGMSACGSGDLCCGACTNSIFYLSVFGGYTQLEQTQLSPGGVALSVDTLEPNDGYGVGIAFGQIQGNNLRSEIEFSFRDHAGTIERFAAGLPEVVGLPVGEGSIQSFAGMFNLLWDFNPRPIFFGFRPYAGAGAGFGFFDVDFTTEFIVSGSDSAFAYQFIGGFSRSIRCNTDWFVDYRYFATDEININGRSFDYETDNIFFGIRRRF